MSNYRDFARRSPKIRAATIVDVLAAVSFATILAVLLVPALGSARKIGKADHCLNNLAQIAMASAIYTAQDSLSMALPVHPKQFDQCPGQLDGGVCRDPIYIGAYEWGGKSGVGRGSFMTGAPDPTGLNSKYGSKAGFGPPTRPLNEILYGDIFADAFMNGRFDRIQGQADTELDLGVYECPSDTGVSEMHCPTFVESDNSSYDHFGTSYNANLFMVHRSGGELGPGFATGEMGSNSPYLHGVADVPNPARTLAYQENNGRFAWTAQPEHPDCTWIGLGVAGTANGWHGRDWTFNAAFVDGHVDTIFMRGYHNEPDGTSGQQCIRVRGEGWQIDTLPAPFARTLLIHSGSGRPSYEDCVWTDAAKANASAAGKAEGCVR